MSGKRSTGSSANSKPKRTRKGITLDVKLDILQRFAAGEKLSAISKTLGLATSTVATIRDSRDRIMASAQVATPLSARTLYFHRSEVMLNMERLLSVWIQDQGQLDVPLNMIAIQSKAKSLYNDLVKEEGSGAHKKPFQASKGWFDRFRKRFNLNNVQTADVEVAINYPSELKKIIDEEGFLPGQVFNADETVLFWKRLPERTFISIEEQSAAGFKASRDHLALLLGGNAAGDFKLKPVIVYSCENPRALQGYAKPNLPVIWCSNRKAWMTAAIFHDWFINHFCPALERYCAKCNIPNKALLILDKAPSHPLHLNNLTDNVRVEYLSKNTKALLQPMDQGVIANFKRYYLRKTFAQLVNATDGHSKPTVREFWKSFNIMNAIDNISESWDEVSISTMNGAWKNIWPECVSNFGGIPPAEPAEKVTSDIVGLANEAGFQDIVDGDVIQLLDSQNEDLSNEDLVLLEQERSAEEAEDQEPPAPLQLQTSHLSDVLSYIDQVVHILSANDPNRERSLKVGRLLQDAISCYRQMYKERMRNAQQIPVDAFLIFKIEPPSPPT